MRALIRKSLLPLLLFLNLVSHSQTYTLNGSAVQNSCNCYTLTNETMNQSGSVWNNGKIDLTQPFDFKFNVFLGCSDFGGADGIAFILQTQATSVGRTGSGLGFAGVSPSIGIALDTYQNTFAGSDIDDLNDPSFDHISIQANGIVKHGNDLANPVPASVSSDNIEDCQWHVLRITWNPESKTLQAYFDWSLRVQTEVDLQATIFGGQTSVYWGFSASTGGAFNVQQFCTALNPEFTTNFPNNGTCIGTPVSFNDQSLSFAPIASYYWDFGDGTSSNAATPPAHNYTAPGAYPVRLAITGLDGCKSDTLEKIVTIGSTPNAAFTVSDVCFGSVPEVDFGAPNFGTTYQWMIDGVEVSKDEVPLMDQVEAGSYTLERRVLSAYGCGADQARQPLTIKPIPVIDAEVPVNICKDVSTLFKARQLDNTGVQQWHWTFGDGQKTTLQNPTYTYRRTGAYTTNLWAVGTNGCSSDTVVKTITVHEAVADAGKDTIVLNSVPFTLSGTGEGTASWSPPAGLNRSDILNPMATLSNDQQYELTITSPEGCTAKDSVWIEVFKGSVIYVPTAFTPNGNGLNDALKPSYTGIRKLHYFRIYNRWGQAVFTTTNLGQGWDGRHAGTAVSTGTFVWMLRAEDIMGQVYNLKGTFTLIR